MYLVGDSSVRDFPALDFTLAVWRLWGSGAGVGAGTGSGSGAHVKVQVQVQENR